MPSPARDTDVLVVGAGPTGLVLALWLTRRGARVRIIDKLPAPATTSRALAVQARTLELYAQLGLADAVVARGRKAAGANLWVAGRKVARAPFGDIGAGVSPYPYALIYPQDEHERMLIDRLHADGVEVERSTELSTFDSSAESIRARLRRPDGSSETCDATYIAGCDGAHSVVRQQLNIAFPGGTYEHVFYVADVDARGAVMNGEVHVALDRNDFLALFPLYDAGRARLVGTVRSNAESRREITWEDVGKQVIEWMRIDVDRVRWLSTYRVHHRVADRFRAGRAFLLGDAAHIHSPVGGQGMNTGIGDAVNLAWKLADVIVRRAGTALLDSYEPERIAFARRLVNTTDRAFVAVTSDSTLARLIRLKIAPPLIAQLFAIPRLRRLMFRIVSQTAITYRESELSEGPDGGDRLPWVDLGDGGDNFAPLSSLDWQVHVYGTATADLRELCARRALPIHEFAWSAAMRRQGIARDALYLVRPDGHIGLSTAQTAERLAAYLDRWHLRFV